MTTASPNSQKIAPFHHDIVGSFLRPSSIKEARLKFQNNEITLEQLKQVEDREITRLVEQQKAAGLQGVTDGEFRRSWWHLDFFWGLDGVEKVVLEQGYKFQGIETRAETARLTGKVKFNKHPMLQHYQFLHAAVGESDSIARMTIPSPAQFLSELQRAENKESTDAIYPNIDDLVADVAQAYKEAIQAFYDLGCRNLQLDDCTWGMLCDKHYWTARQQDGVDVNEVSQRFATINNEAINGHPTDMVITMHVCRGNYRSTWASAGGYDPIAQVLFGTVNVDAFYLEYDTDRAGDFAPLRHIKNQKVVLGLVSSKTPQLENKADIIQRIHEAAQYVPLDRLCLSPQCGFASTEEGNELTEEDQWRKLQLIKEVAEEVWGKK